MSFLRIGCASTISGGVLWGWYGSGRRVMLNVCRFDEPIRWENRRVMTSTPCISNVQKGLERLSQLQVTLSELVTLNYPLFLCGSLKLHLS